MSYAAIQQPETRQIVDADGVRYVIQTFTDTDQGLGSCHPSIPCAPQEAREVLTEVYVLQGAAAFQFGDDGRGQVATLARSVRCPDHSSDGVRANFVGIGTDSFGAWHFFGLCPGDAPEGL